MPKSKKRPHAKTKRGLQASSYARAIHIAKARAAEKVRANNMCRHEVETVVYSSRLEAEADQTPNKICTICGFKILRASVSYEGKK